MAGPTSPRAVEGKVATGSGNPGPRAGRDLSARIRWLHALGAAFHGVALGAALVFLALVLALVGELISGAGPSIQRFGWGFLSGSAWDGVHDLYGAWPAVVGTLLTSALALLFAVPVALGVAVFLSEIAPVWLREPLTYVVDLSAAIPSVVYGFWAYIVVVPFMRANLEPGLQRAFGTGFPFSGVPLGLDLLTASLVLAAMILPTVAAVAREALRSVPRLQRESALSLGATRWEATRLAVLGPARSGIAGGVILGLGRAVGETIAVTMVIGNIYSVPTSLFSPSQTIASQIANNFGEVGIGLQQSALIELGLILLAVTIAVNVAARLLIWGLAGSPRASSPKVRAGHAGGTRRHARLTERLATLRRGSGPADLRAAGLGWRARALAAAPHRIRRRRQAQLVVIALTMACVAVTLFPLASVLLTAVSRGGAAVVQPSFYTDGPPLGCNPRPGVTCSLGGMGPAIEGTLLMLGIGALIALPIGILVGIYLSEYGRGSARWYARTLSFLADVMTGVPTVLVGVFVFLLFLRYDHDAATSALSGGVALAVVMVPIAIRATEESLRFVPRGVREAALALGFPRHRVAARVVLGSARGPIVTGLLLALSRAGGDTAALIFTAGNSSYYAQNLTSPTAAITPFIWFNFSSEYANLQEDAWGAALVLLALMLVISVGARLAVRRANAAGEGA
ncbi:MAG TPA: phosphate ABC transporter permease subunit PstC [Thermoplasmata archaeon]|nr:phosphate ABC transporter permease subunit PstC [Thermoplasmata archaeon]